MTAAQRSRVQQMRAACSLSYRDTAGCRERAGGCVTRSGGIPWVYTLGFWAREICFHQDTGRGGEREEPFESCCREVPVSLGKGVPESEGQSRLLSRPQGTEAVGLVPSDEQEV